MNLVLDLDGTLCDCRHRLHYIEPPLPEWDMFHRLGEVDVPILPVLVLVRTLVASGWTLLIQTGRPEKVRPGTESWLHRHQVYYSGLQMRPSGNREHTVDLKRRWMQEYALTPENTIVLEDQPRTIVALRNDGWTVLANFTDLRLS